MEILKFPKKSDLFGHSKNDQILVSTSRLLIAKKSNSGYGPLIELDFEWYLEMGIFPLTAFDDRDRPRPETSSGLRDITLISSSALAHS